MAAPSNGTGASKSALAVFEDSLAASLKSLQGAFARLEEENADLRAKLAAANARLAVYEPVEEPPFTSERSLPTSPLTVLQETPASSADKSKFRAVKDFLFKPKKEKEPVEKGARDPPPELWAGPDRGSKKGSNKKKTDRWLFCRALEGHTKPVDEVSMCPHDPYILGTCSRDGTARLWGLDTSGGSASFSGHKNGAVNSIRFNCSSTARSVCTAGTDGTVQIFKIPTFMLHQKSPKDILARRCSSGSGGLGGDGSSPYMSPEQSDEDSISATPPHTPRMTTPRGSVVPTLAAPAVEVKSVVSLPAAAEFSEHQGSVIACDWIVGSETLVSGGQDATLRVIDANTLQATSIDVQFAATEGDPQLTNIFSHPNQPIVIAPSSDGLARVWDVRDMKLIDLIAHSSDKGCVTHALFSHDGGLIITGGDDRSVKLWDARHTQTPLDAIRCGSMQSKFSLSRRTNTLAIPMRDGKLKICDTQGHNVGACDTHKHHKEALLEAVWSEDETFIFTASLDDRYNVLVWSRDGAK